MLPRFTPSSTISAIYRLTVPLPVTVEWPWGSETLYAIANEHPPRGASYFRTPKGDYYAGQFQSLEHAHFTYANGCQVEIRSRPGLFFERLVGDGRAEYVAGPHSELNWLSRFGLADAPELNAFYLWRDCSSTVERHPDQCAPGYFLSY